MGASTVIGIPEREGDFERHCRVLFAELIGDPHTKLVATRGKDQGGFDIIGTRNGDPDRPVGIQCKNKPKGGRLKLDDVRSDITRMLAFEPPVAEIFVVTTASDDLAYDKLALEMRQAQKRWGRDVVIQIWGWDTLTDYILSSAAATKAFDPDRSPSTSKILRQGERTIELQVEQIDRQGEMMTLVAAIDVRTQQMVAPIDTGTGAAVDAVLDKQIDGIRDLLNRGRPKSALTMLDALEAQSTGRSAAIRSRILGNKGFAYLRLGDERRAGELLLEAHAVNPDDPKARANRVLGLILSSNVEKAVGYGQAVLADDPGNRAAAAFVYQAAAMSEDDIGPDAIVAEEMRDDENVGVTRTAYLRRHRAPPAWRDWATARSAAHPGSTMLQQFAAEAILDEAYERRAFMLGDSRHPDRSLMEGAAALLRTLWDNARQNEDAAHAGATGIAHNLITAYRALRDIHSADEVARQAMDVAPDDEGIRIAAAHVDNIMDRHTDALVKLIDLADGPQRTIPLLSAHAGLGEWSEVARLATPQRGAALSGLDRQGFDCLAAQANLEISPTESAAGIIDALVLAWPGVLHVAASAADMARRHSPSDFERHFENAMLIAGDDAPLPERMVLAEIAITTENFEAVIDVLDGYVDTDQPSEPLAWLALSFANAPTRPRTHTFFEQLPQSVMAQGRYARLAGAAEYNRGDLASAEKHLRQAVRADPTDLRAHLMLQSTLQRDGRNDEATDLARRLDEHSVSGSAIDRMRLAVALRRAGEADRALALGFAIAVANQDEEDVSAAYPQLLFMSEARIPAIEESDETCRECWIDLEGLGCADIAGVITADAIPEVLTFPPDHPVAIAVEGRRVDDEVVLPPALGIERRYRFRDVKHKWVWLSHRILRDHGARFPESTGFVEMTMEDGDISPVLDVVRRTEDHARTVMDMYKSTAIPLAIVAALHRRDVVGLAQRIAASGESIKTCVGLHSERRAAERAVSRGRGVGAVLDTYTLVVAEALELLPILRAHFGTLVIARTTVDEMMRWRAAQEINAGRETMHIGYEDDQAVRHVQSAEDNDLQLARLDALLEAARAHCEIRTPDGHPNALDGQLLDASGLGDVLDPIRIAERDGLTLLSDDLHYRQLARMGGVAASAWLQAAALVFRANASIDCQDYAPMVVRLAARRHNFVTVDALTLLSLLGRDGDEEDLAFSLAARSIGGARADLASHSGVVLDFACAVWSSPIASWRKGRAISRLLENLMKGLGDAAAQFIDTLEASLATRRGPIDLRPDLAREHLAGWRLGHFIDAHGTPMRTAKRDKGLRKKNAL